MKKARLSHVQVIVLGYLIIILLGTLALMLPASSADGQRAPFRTALFTATSASCVTGLVLRDTVTGWSPLGQAVILLLIQVGGLGFMTIATLLYLLLHKRMGLQQREIMVESINTTQVGGLMRLTRLIVAGTAAFELGGALLLAIRFVPRLGWARGLWYSLFHAVSAFCNAGFDLMGRISGPFGSLVPFAGDGLVNAVMIVLITVGGLGFLVWEDIRRHGLRWRRYRLHTKLVLASSALLTFGGAALLCLFERNATGAGLPAWQQALQALFGSVTARTAGFNTVEVGEMASASKLLYLVLMLVGGSPGSTAGGVKTTTVAVILLWSAAGFHRQKKPAVFGRSISEEMLRKSTTVLFFNLGLALTAAVAICAMQPLQVIDVLFETFSAMGTVGMTTGITRDLTAAASGIIMMLMFMGRVGSVSFAVAILEKKAQPPVLCPEESITVG